MQLLPFSVALVLDAHLFHVFSRLCFISFFRRLIRMCAVYDLVALVYCLGYAISVWHVFVLFLFHAHAYAYAYALAQVNVLLFAVHIVH